MEARNPMVASAMPPGRSRSVERRRLLAAALPAALVLALSAILAIDPARAASPSYLPLLVLRDTDAPAQATPSATRDPGAPATLPPPNPVAWPPPAGPDALGEVLANLGQSRQLLGYRPKGDWTRFPLPERTDYLLPAFRPVYAEPLRAYDLARGLGNAADRWLHPYQVKDAGLYRATYYLGLDRLVGNFREYSANLHGEPAAADPLREALRDVYQYAREDLVHFSFGGASSWDNMEERIGRELAGQPEGLQRELARGLLNSLEAIRWRDRALRRVPPELARQVFAIRDLGDSQGDGTVYYAEIDDLMRLLDAPSLYYAGQQAVETAQALRLALAALPEAERCPVRPIDIPTPFGRLHVGSCGADNIEGTDFLLLVDPGGDDQHRHNGGGTTQVEMPLSIAVDLAGDDVWDCQSQAAGACQGAGVLGAGVLVDAAGDDRYEAGHHAQGLGLIGLGLLFDAQGRDQYAARYSAQGSGYFGYGALMDGSGDDRYRLAFDGQGYGGVGGGVGVLADRSGDDQYTATMDVRELPPELQYRNYAGNGQPNTVVSFVQGAAAGRRGDGSDGHSWPGGLGALVDVMGNDRYQAGAFAQAYGYWYGIGLVYDGAGDDLYQSVYYSIASGAHYAVAALIDEAGNDQYRQVQTLPQSTAGAGVAFAWDFVVSLLFDRSGDDVYESNVNALGRSAEKGNAYLVDGSGNDRYIVGANADGSGRADTLGSSGWRNLFGADPYRGYLTGFETGVFSLLLDLGGTDQYLAKDFAGGNLTAHQAAADGRSWLNPDPAAPAPGVAIPGFRYADARFYGLGVDREGGRIPEFDRIPPPATPAPTAPAAAAAEVARGDGRVPSEAASDGPVPGAPALDEGRGLYRVPRRGR